MKERKPVFDHNTMIKKEFARQSESMYTALVFTDNQILERIISAASVTDKIRVLDVGCGPGILTTALALKAKEVFALDITPEMIERARERSLEKGLNNIKFEVGQAEKLPFEDDYFDVVVTRLTIHHFKHPELVVSEMARVTRPSGRIVIVDIISSEDIHESELHNALEVLRDPSHVKMLTYTELKNLVESRGLSIIKEDRWIMEREYNEWIQITNAPEREKPLYTIMRRFVESGIKSGINLRFDGHKLKFNHTWTTLVAKKVC